MAFYRRILSALAALLALSIGVCAALAEAGYDMNAPENLAAEHLFAESALLVDEASGEVLFSKNSRVRMYPASTTKIMTLLLALESDIPLDAQVTIPPEAADIPEGSSVVPVKPGDVTSFSDLLYGFMLSSGNDGANAVAVLVDGGIEAFVARMNARAEALGCEGTHFVNAHGYHNSEHYTTAQDLALIAREAMGNESFRRIVAAPRWTMTIQRDGKELQNEIVSRNSLLQSGEKYYYSDCTGIKTGHHSKAGWCFVGSAQRDGKRVICVVLNCKEEMSKWYDAARLFEYGFTRYAPVPVSELLDESLDRLATVRVEDADEADPEGGSLRMDLTLAEGADAQLQLVSGSVVARRVAAAELASGASVEWTRPLTAPISQGDEMGTLTLRLPGGEAVTARLTASRSVAARPRATQKPTRAPAPSAVAGEPAAPKASGGAPVGFIALLAVLGAALACAALAAHGVRAKRKKAMRRARRARPQSRESGGGRASRGRSQPSGQGRLKGTSAAGNRRR